MALHRTRYEWRYVYRFVHPAGGRSPFLLLPTVNTALMSLALREFQREVNPEGSRSSSSFWTTQGGTGLKTSRYRPVCCC